MLGNVVDRSLSQHLANLVQNEKATCRGVRDIITIFYFGFMDWDQLRGSLALALPCQGLRLLSGGCELQGR